MDVTRRCENTVETEALIVFCRLLETDTRDDLWEGEGLLAVQYRTVLDEAEFGFVSTNR